MIIKLFLNPNPEVMDRMPEQCFYCDKVARYLIADYKPGGAIAQICEEHLVVLREKAKNGEFILLEE